MKPPTSPLARLSEVQRAFVRRELGAYTVLIDHTWPLQDTVVCEATSQRGHVIIKAGVGDITGSHLDCEITALRETVPRAPGLPRLIAASLSHRVLITAHLPGQLVEGTAWEYDPGVYRQAGQLLALVHGALPARRSDDYLPRIWQRTQALLARARELPGTGPWQATGQMLAGISPGPAFVVLTHGDMQPRNWLVDESRPDPDGVPAVSLIDFGRAEWRPWYSDLVRLHHQQFLGRPHLREAMWQGAGWRGTSPVGDQERAGWLLENLLQSLGSLVWATQIGDTRFAAQGRQMLQRTLAME